MRMCATLAPGPGGVVVLERLRVGHLRVLVEAGVRGVRLPGPVRGLVVQHEAEGALGVAPLEPVQGEVGDQVGGVAGVGRRTASPRGSRHLEELRVVVGPLSGEHPPEVEALGMVLRLVPQVPLPTRAVW